MRFQIWDAADPADRQAWIDCWQQWPGREVFAHPDYVRLYAAPATKALCAAFLANGSCILYPFLLRSLGAERYCAPALRDSADIVTPYGYGGPFRWGETSGNSEIAPAFWSEFNAWAAAANVVSEVVRFFLFPEAMLEYPGDRRTVLDNVVRSLGSEDELWRNFEHKVRKNVNKARAAHVTVQVDEGGERLDEFLGVYAGTMERRNAAEKYFFPREYFERFRTDLKEQCVWFHACVGAKIISTELVLISADRIYSFLGGTDSAWFHVRPNDLLKFEIMNWARYAGKSEFVLGGGYSRGDSIYRYKLSFAPNGSVPFSIGFRILNIKAYERLTQARHNAAMIDGGEQQPNPEYFPAYRG
jgi:hypothetical protein